MRPLATFRVRPERRSRLSLQVEVFANAREFRRVERSESPRMRTRGLVGSCMRVTERRRGRRTGLFAIVRIPREHLTMTTISHEAFHATMRWAQRRGILAVPTDGSDTGGRTNTMRNSAIGVEERCATICDAICRRIVIECHRRKLFPPEAGV